MKTVLLVDDIPEYLDTMEINLPEGCQAVRGMSQDDARGLVAEKAPDAAVVDVRLKEGDAANRDGLELLRWIRANYPETKVIVISAYREFEFEAEALALGAEYFLRKPIQPEEFRAAVAKVLTGAGGRE